MDLYCDVIHGDGFPAMVFNSVEECYSLATLRGTLCFTLARWPAGDA